MDDKMSKVRPGFFQQLRLVLWKNFVTKKRHPIVFLLEILIPLTLFIVLVCIRRSQHAYPIPKKYYSPQPLPSAGIVPVLQAFCSDSSQVYTKNNTRLYAFLKHLENEFKEKHDVLDNFSYSGLDKINDILNDNEGNLFEILGLLQEYPFSSIAGIASHLTTHIDSKDVTSYCGNDVTSTTQSSESTTSGKRLDAFTSLWRNIEPLLCGTEVKGNNSNNTDHSTTDAGEGRALERKMEILYHILYNNPRILFAPNNTATLKIIQKMNTSVAVVSNITHYAHRWQEISTNLRKQLSLLQNIYSSELDKGQLAKVNHTMNVLDSLACAWLTVMKGVNFNVFRGFQTETDLEYYFLNKQYHDNVTVLAGLVFENLDDSMASLPSHVYYKIRQNATINPSTDDIRPPFWYPTPGSDDLLYYKFGFVWIQDLVERAIIDLQVGKAVRGPGTLLHRMPYPCWSWDGFIWLIQHVLPLCLMISCVYPVAVLVQRIVYEKEKRLKEVMKMMGLSDAVHWCGWFITAGSQLTLTVTMLTLILYYGHILPNSNPVLVFVFLELFALSSVAFSFLISSLYSRAKLAAACAGIFYFITYVPYMYITIREITGDRISHVVKIISALFPTSALGLGGKYFLYYEMEGSGLQWSNLHVSPLEHDSFGLHLVFTMIATDTVLYFILAWYIEHVLPGTYGIPKPWYFPFACSYWFGVPLRGMCSLQRLVGIHGRKRRYSLLDDNVEGHGVRCEMESDVYNCGCNTSCSTRCNCSFEKDPVMLRKGVVVSNLTKNYNKGDTPAVDGLSMKLYENQITAFLGHNGAGKTTTMSILTGMFPPTSGTATIYGHDIRTDMDTIRQDLGICPQYNVLFDSLTVDEHLWFYSGLKGLSHERIKQDIPVILRDLFLIGKGCSRPGALSGGMQRKLSIAIAFIGGSRTVILDEPTAGVDPYSRKAIWNLLAKYKTGKTVLVSTHHLDEAETLGDRLLILADGKLKCAGSPAFLKSKLGDGYRLHILKGDDSPEDIDNRILYSVKMVVPSSYIAEKSSNELHITVPLLSDEKRSLIKLFQLLEHKRSEMGIKSYGISDGGLEQVFVKVTQGCERIKRSRSVDVTIDEAESTCISDRQSVENDCLQLRCLDDQIEARNIKNRFQFPNKRKLKCLTDFKAVLLKRFFYMLRNRKALFSQIILPAVFVSMAMTIALSAPKNSDPEPLEMSTAQYHDLTKPDGNFIPFSVHTSNVTSKNSTVSSTTFSRRLAETFFKPSGIGASCVIKSNSSCDIKRRNGSGVTFDCYSESCRHIFTVDSVQVKGWERSDVKLNSDARFYPSCNCKSNTRGFNCDNSNVVKVPEWKLVSGDVLQNITSGRNDEEEYLLYTNDEYRRHRYGGFTFGKYLSYVPDFISNSPVIARLQAILATKETNEVWYSQRGRHAMPVYLNAMNNALLRASLHGSNMDTSKYGITLTNHPMKRTNNLLNSEYIQGGTDVLMAIFIIVAMSFVPASFVVFLVHERAIKAKHLQYASGLHPVIYWLSNYLWDMCNYMIPVVCILGILFLFHIEAYVGHGNVEAVIALFLLYGWSITPMMYPASFVFSEPSMAYICLIVGNLFIGITCVVSSFMLQQFGFDKNISEVSAIFDKVFSVFPNYCLGNGMMSIALNHYENEYYSHIGQTGKIRTALSWEVTGKKLVAMAAVGFVSFIFTLLCEYRFCFGSRIVSNNNKSENTETLDSDVLAERHATLNGNNNNRLLSVERLSKVYKTRRRGEIHAVKDLSFSIPKGECFGLLGVNGAGKTTTFRMLTGDLTPTSGDVQLLSQSVVKGGRSTQHCVGYCPQFDAIFNELTPVEHLQLYARLRGIPKAHRDKVIMKCIRLLGLTQYSKKPTGTLSGGTKRKLSTAIALIGQPSLILMDEPTSGMDPYSRRFLWDVIQRIVKDGTSVLFSSHSMEECETLCSRLSIMAKGQLKCIGSVQHIKDKYGDGYTLTITIKSTANSQGLIHHVTSTVSGAKLRQEGHRNIVFDLKIKCSELASVYEMLEELPEQFHVEDYSMNQNTLDNVFINFATSADDVDNDGLAPREQMHDSGYIQDDDDEPLIELHSRPSVSSLESLLHV